MMDASKAGGGESLRRVISVIQGRRVMTEQNEQIELKDAERQKCEVWTRVMGYHRPVQSFNIGKKGEFNERVCFTEKSAVAHGQIAGSCCAR